MTETESRLELVPEGKLHAASRLRVAGGERAVIAAEAGGIGRVGQVADVELRRVGQVEHIPAEAQAMIRDSQRPRLAHAGVDREVAVAPEDVTQPDFAWKLAAELRQRIDRIDEDTR